MTPNKAMFIEALTKNLGNISKTCQGIGVGRQTYYDWLASDEEFRKEAENVKEYILDRVEDKLQELIEKGDTASTIFFLKTQGKKRGYIEKTEMEHSGEMVVWKETKNYTTPTDGSNAEADAGAGPAGG